ncbi:response regulator transcription factor [Olivibacter sp. SA151]|uniref:response regulator n=1 Tax=Olivibacter jilunii TaxID=985016 RepID=UPI003F171D2B
MKATIGIVEDHTLVLKSLEIIINSFSCFEVTLLADSGSSLFEQIDKGESVPDILLIDVLMPEMNGDEVAVRVKKKYANVKLVAISGFDDSASVMKMIRAGCCAYLQKNIELEELEGALQEIWMKGYYNNYLTNMGFQASNTDWMDLRDRELEFLRLACSDLNYHEIADCMCLSIKTIDGYRACLFAKFGVKSRVGLVLEALKHNLISLTSHSYLKRKY